MRNGERYEPACVIAGAGRRLGLAIARRYASEGFVAYMLSRNPAKLEPCIARLRAGHMRVVPLACDVGSPASVESALQEVRKRQGGCDVLIYNAFASSVGRASMLEPEALLADIRVNVTAALSFVRLVVAEMREHGGAMIFSGCGLAGAPATELTSLSVGKAALHAYVACLAADVESDGIRVSMITINGTMPAQGTEIRDIAELYWASFAFGSSLERNPEVIYQPRVRSRGGAQRGPGIGFNHWDDAADRSLHPESRF